MKAGLRHFFQLLKKFFAFFLILQQSEAGALRSAKVKTLGNLFNRESKLNRATDRL
jgi:hypothetical protein